MSKVWVKLRAFVILIIFSYSFNYSYILNNPGILRRLRNIEDDSEFIPDIYFLKTPSPELVLKIIEDLKPFFVLFNSKPQNISSSTWKVGIVLTFLKSIEGLGLENLDIAKWINTYKKDIQELDPSYELETPTDLDIFTQTLENIKTTSQESYLALQSECINYYFIEFLQNYTEHDLFNMPQETREDREDFILGSDMLNLHNRRIPTSRQVETSDLVPEDYLPDLYTLAYLKATDPQAYKSNIYDYLLNNFIRFETKGYAQRWLRGVKYYSEVTQIKHRIFQEMDIKNVRAELENHYKELGLAPEVIKRVINTANEHLLRDLLVDLETNRLIAPDVDRFINQNYPQIRRIVWSAFFASPYSLKGEKLINTLTISEAEYLARKLIQMYFSKMTAQIPVGVENIDPHIIANKNKNRISLLDWKITEEEINQIIATSGTTLEPSASSTPEQIRLYRNITYFLLKKLATAGIYDLSMAQIRSRFSSSASLTGLEETHSLRQYRFEINSFNKFFNEVITPDNGNIKLVVSADNNGEIIYLLGFIKYILRMNPKLTVVLIPRSIPVADDIYSKGLFQILDYDYKHNNYFSDLNIMLRNSTAQKRFLIVSNGPDFQGEYLRVMSKQEYNAFTIKNLGRQIFDKIIYLGIGNANFVSTQGLNMDRYYLYRVKAERVAEATGIDKEGNPLIFAYLPAKVCIGTAFGGKNRYTTLIQFINSHPQYYIIPED